MTGFYGNKSEYRTSRHFVIARRFQSATYRWMVFEGKDITGTMKTQGRAGTRDDAQTAGGRRVDPGKRRG